ncbi:Glutaredoxin domain-containing protein [Pleurotus pulmonarius]
MEKQRPLSSSGLMAATTSVRRSRVLLFAALVLAGLFFFGYTPSGLTRANIVALVKPAVQVDEIYGLLHFVTREDGKQFDPGFDVSKPLDLDTYAQGEKSVVWSEVMKEFNTQAPIVVFSKTYCPYSKKAKALLKKYDTSPAPTIVEVDLRDDDVQIKALLTRLTGRGTFPNVIVRGKTIGGSDDVRDLHSKGLLRPKLEDAGVIVQGRDSEIVV